MKKNIRLFATFTAIILLGLALASCGKGAASEPSGAQTENLSEEARSCIECHATETQGIVADWDGSVHAAEVVSCIDCHEVDLNSPMALQNVKGHEDLTVSVSMLVPPSVCEDCHEDQVAQFHASGHQRAGLQYETKDAMQTLIHVYEGRNNPELSGASDETGCMQCHGTRIEVDETGHPTPETYPSAGIGNIYPNEEVGNCTVCHSRHSFEIAEARKPEACGGCHLGPDHPDLEIYENTKHGQIYNTEGEKWVWDRAPGEWEPGDYRAPTCAVCHMSGIGDLEPTHNVSQRLYWNLWAPASNPRGSDDPMSGLTGNAEAGRAEMKQVCGVCHNSTHTESYFASGDKAVQLYNDEYWAPVEAMRVELSDEGLLKDNPWEDEFLILHYYIWHHDGRRARQGAMMGAPDWAHWHGFFTLQQKLDRAMEIYSYRMETGEIERIGVASNPEE